MTLQTRLLLTVGVLVAAALLVTGVLVVGLTRASLVGQLDDQLRLAAAGRLDRVLGLEPGEDDPSGRQLAVIVVGPANRVLLSLPSGPAVDPDPLPDLGGLTRGDPGAPTRIVDGRSEDGSVEYRVLVGVGPRDTTAVLAAPLTGVEDAIAVLVRNLVIVGGLVLAAVVVVGGLLIRRELRPLEDIAATATRISAGDLSERAVVVDPRTEVGRVGTAFNEMLDQIQAAFGRQQAALVAKERSEQRLRQFVADASHELRTPLTTVRGYAELYQAGGLADQPELDKAMARIDAESRRMAVLTHDLLLLARLDQGRPLRHEPVDLTRIVREAIADFRAMEPQRTVGEAIADDITVLGDEDRLRQVVGNLLANVRVHTPVESTMELGLAVEGSSAVLRVADRGPGIEPGHAERVFDRFYRADPARSRDKGGSGLGLAIAGSVLAEQGGSIVYSPTPGGGATFTVTLPIAASSTEAAHVSASTESPATPAVNAETGAGALTSGASPARVPGAAGSSGDTPGPDEAAPS